LNPIAIIQARLGSTRLPGKVLRDIVGRPMLWHIVQRVRSVKGVEDVVVATSDTPQDEPIRQFCAEHGIGVFAGSENDVLDRFYRAAKFFAGDPVIRITADCPLTDPEVIHQLLDLYAAGEFDHVGVATGAGAAFLDGGRFPDGLDAECFSYAALERAWREAAETSDREHVTPYIWRVAGRFRLGILKSREDYSALRWTVDNEADFQLISHIYNALFDETRPFLMQDVLNYLGKNPQLVESNSEFIGREGYKEVWRPNHENPMQ